LLFDLWGDAVALEPKKPISLSALTFFVFVLLATMGWYLVLFLLGTSQKGYEAELVELGKEVLKVAVIAMAAAVAMDRLLRNTIEDQRTTLGKLGIKSVLASRVDAASDFLKCVRDDSVRHITIVGISLRDFLTPGNSMDQVWNEICERMKREQEKHYPPDRRLHLRLLLLLPNSDEGFFRHDVECSKLGSAGGLPVDVRGARAQVQRAQMAIFKSVDTDYLMVRFYEHCPFAFAFATESQVFVEQYDYRDQSLRSAMPLIVFDGSTKQYKEQIDSLQVMWDNSRSPEVIDEVGTASALRGARIRNIYRRDDRQTLTVREIAAIRNAKEGTIDIQVISGRFYTSNADMARALQDISRPGENGRPALTVRFASINPVSQQAILRAIADSTSPRHIGDTLREWNWQRHRECNLYLQTKDTARTLLHWRDDKGCQIEVRAYSSAVASSVLQTDSRQFSEPYWYGRSRAFHTGVDLGGECAVIEHDTSKDGRVNDAVVEHEIIDTTFDIVWKFFSVPWEEYAKRNMAQEFEVNLALLRTELGVAEVQHA
jgi:hypothetical protein